MKRRIFLETTLVAVNLPLALALGLLRPGRALAGWPADAFSATALDEALGKLVGDSPLTPSEAIEIKARDIVEDGSSVPVTIRSGLPGTRSIALLSEKNPNPAVARFTISPRVEAQVSTRIKMGGTGDLVAVAEAEGRYYVARRRVKVTVGGCGA